MLYLYARVSTDKQENGREAQVAKLVDWTKAKGLGDHVLFVDEDVSAFSTPLQHRAEGRKLWDALRPGDTVVMTKVDRGFRSWADAANTHATWLKLGVHLRFADLDIDLATPQGELFFSQIVAFSQYESRMHGQRKREVYAHKRASGLPYNSLRPYGWVQTKDKAGRLAGWEVSAKERATGDRVLRMREAGVSLWKIASTLACEGVKKPQGRKTSSGYYHVQDILMLARAAKAGYPRLPQGFWQARDYERKLDAAISGGSQLSS